MPEGYFEQFPASLNDFRRNAQPRLRWLPRAAAAIAILIMLAGGLYLWGPTNADQAQVSDLSSDEIHEFLNEHIDEIDALLLADFLGEPELELAFVIELEDETISELLLDDLTEIDLYEL